MLRLNPHFVGIGRNLTCTILCFVLVLGKTKPKTFFSFCNGILTCQNKKFFFVLTKPKRNRAGQVVITDGGSQQLFVTCLSDSACVERVAYSNRAEPAATVGEQHPPHTGAVDAQVQLVVVGC